MKEFPFSSLLSVRKDQLQKQIDEAAELNDSKKLYMLACKWAHRYGLTTMPNILQDENNIELLIPTKRELQSSPKFVADASESQHNPETWDRSLKHSSESEDNLIDFGEGSFDISEFKSFNSDQLENLNNNSQVEPNDISKNKPKTGSPSIMSPPPRPSLKNFRRWIPDFEDSVSKAS